MNERLSELKAWLLLCSYPLAVIEKAFFNAKLQGPAPKKEEIIIPFASTHSNFDPKNSCNSSNGNTTYTGKTVNFRHKMNNHIVNFRHKMNIHITACRYGTSTDKFDNHIFNVVIRTITLPGNLILKFMLL